MAAEPAPPPSGTILLVSERSGAPVVHAIASDGGGDRAIATGPGAVFPGGADPQGTHALVLSAEDGPEFGHRERLWLVPLAGGEPAPLVPATERVRNPAWAPDGSFVVYESDAHSYRDLYRVDRAGGDAKRLTEAQHGSFEPAVSPDGSRIVFGTSRDENAEIYTMKADGSDPVRVTNDVADDVRPGWAPNGGTVSWITHREGLPRVWLAAADGADPRPLRPSDGVDVDYAWSPDGKRIAVTVQTGPDELDVHVIDVASGRRLGTLGGAGVDEHPAWSPDGAWIVWSATRDRETDLRLARPDGKDERQLTKTKGADWLPRWIPG